MSFQKGPIALFRLSQLSIKTRIETNRIRTTPDDLPCLSQLSIKTRIETDLRDYPRDLRSSCLSQLSIKTRIETEKQSQKNPNTQYV